jgi:hypothetical protein
MLMLLCASSDQRVLFGEDAHDLGGDFVVNDGLVVLADDVNTEFLGRTYVGLKLVKRVP